MIDETRNLVGKDFFHAMRAGALFINTARADIVDQDALVRAVKDDRTRAGLDVFVGQPARGSVKIDNDIFETYGIIGTHHIGVETSQAQQAIAQETLRIVREYRSTGQPPNVIADTK